MKITFFIFIGLLSVQLALVSCTPSAIEQPKVVNTESKKSINSNKQNNYSRSNTNLIYLELLSEDKIIWNSCPAPYLCTSLI